MRIIVAIILLHLHLGLIAQVISQPKMVNSGEVVSYHPKQGQSFSITQDFTRVDPVASYNIIMRSSSRIYFKSENQKDDMYIFFNEYIAPDDIIEVKVNRGSFRIKTEALAILPEPVKKVLLKEKRTLKAKQNASKSLTNRVTIKAKEYCFDEKGDPYPCDNPPKKLISPKKSSALKEEQKAHQINSLKMQKESTPLEKESSIFSTFTQKIEAALEAIKRSLEVRKDQSSNIIVKPLPQKEIDEEQKSALLPVPLPLPPKESSSFLKEKAESKVQEELKKENPIQKKVKPESTIVRREGVALLPPHPTAVPQRDFPVPEIQKPHLSQMGILEPSSKSRVEESPLPTAPTITAKPVSSLASKRLPEVTSQNKDVIKVSKVQNSIQTVVKKEKQKTPLVQVQENMQQISTTTTVPKSKVATNVKKTAYKKTSAPKVQSISSSPQTEKVIAPVTALRPISEVGKEKKPTIEEEPITPLYEETKEDKEPKNRIVITKLIDKKSTQEVMPLERMSDRVLGGGYADMHPKGEISVKAYSNGKPISAWVEVFKPHGKQRVKTFYTASSKKVKLEPGTYILKATYRTGSAKEKKNLGRIRLKEGEKIRKKVYFNVGVLNVIAKKGGKPLYVKVEVFKKGQKRRYAYTFSARNTGVAHMSLSEGVYKIIVREHGVKKVINNVFIKGSKRKTVSVEF